MFPLKLHHNDYFLDYLNEGNAFQLFTTINENRNHLKKWLAWLDSCLSIEDSVIFIKNCITAQESNSALTLAIWDHNKIIGLVSYHKFDWSTSTSSIGYWLSEPYCRKGIMTESCRLLIDYGFYNLFLEKITISCAELNERSMAIPKKLNFVQKEKIPNKEWLYDHYVDHVIFEISKDRWKNVKYTSNF